METNRLRLRTVWVFGPRAAGLVVVLCFATAACITRACPYSIRDATFMSVDEPAPFELYFLAPQNEESRGPLAEWVAAASETWLADTNVGAQGRAPSRIGKSRPCM